MSLVTDLLQILEEGKKVFDQEFLSFAYQHPSIKREFTDLSELEDLFDYAYLEDVRTDELCEILTHGKKKLPTEQQVEREALSRVKWCIDNMSKENKKVWKSKMMPIAQEWAKKIAPYVVAKSEDYID
jgi:hypothetical protein